MRSVVVVDMSNLLVAYYRGSRSCATQRLLILEPVMQPCGCYCFDRGIAATARARAERRRRLSAPATEQREPDQCQRRAACRATAGRTTAAAPDGDRHRAPGEPSLRLRLGVLVDVERRDRLEVTLCERADP